MSPQQMNISAHAAPSHYTSVDAINRHDYGVQKARKPASTGGGRAWSDDEEAYLRQARLQKMPYKHIAAHLKKTELACRLHHHQLSHGSNRRTRTSSVTSSNAGSNAGSNASSIAGSDAGSLTPSPIMSHSIPSPISENTRAATPPTYNYSRQPPFHFQLPSAAMLIQRADSSSPPPQRVSHPVAILPKPSSPHRALSDSAANRALRLDCGLASGPVNIPAVDQERLRQIYDAHRASFWGLVACEYGAGASPLLLEETWKRGILTTNALPTPCVSPAPDAQPFHDIHLGYNTKPLHRLPTPVPETKLNATSISALLGIDASPRSPSEREFVRRMEERRDNRATNMAGTEMGQRYE
ncbi:hypothetical protein B2J93_1530 [Marssonina coronariae]|uniref:Myb-like domain-containing protein n=1 Tax=Diplocarpon coronariae TaxID=2795749 RepID=A0A218Z272_9HELO|nr:hypothetical protein B2J93_1530 [Marssonina coronariae]